MIFHSSTLQVSSEGYGAPISTIQLTAVFQVFEVVVIFEVVVEDSKHGGATIHCLSNPSLS
jgi:hypothetical protein